MDTLPTNPVTTAPWWQHYSTWVSILFAALVAAPIDWNNFDFTKLSMNDVLRSVIYLVLFIAAKKVRQTSTTQDQP